MVSIFDVGTDAVVGSSDASGCPNGVPTGRSVDISLITQAVNNTLTNCPAS